MSPRTWIMLGGLNAGLLVFNVVRALTWGSGIMWLAIAINILAMLACWFGWRIAVETIAHRQQFDREIEELMRRRGR